MSGYPSARMDGKRTTIVMSAEEDAALKKMPGRWAEGDGGHLDPVSVALPFVQFCDLVVEATTPAPKDVPAEARANG